MTDFIDIKDAIITVLESLKGEGKPFAEVYDELKEMPDTYPCAMVDISGASDERFDTANNEVTVGFLIRVLVLSDNTATSRNQRIEIAQQVMDEFRKAANVDTLGGLVHRMNVRQTRFYDTQGSDPVLVFDMELSLSFLSPIF